MRDAPRTGHMYIRHRYEQAEVRCPCLSQVRAMQFSNMLLPVLQ